MPILLAILLMIVTALGGFALGLFLSRRQVKQMFM